MHPTFIARSKTAQPIWFVTQANFSKVIDKLDKRTRAFVKASGFEPRPGRHLLLPGHDGTGGALFGIESGKGDKNAFLPGLLPGALPAGVYRFANEPHDARLAALAFALGSYRFTRYRKTKDKAVRLVLPDGVDGEELSRIAEGVMLARDLINTPANDMGPADLEAAAKELAKQHGAKFRSIVGDDLLKQNFPLIHAVGRAADATRAPRLIELRWGKTGDPKVTLVGKGVCFDTGGLDLKPESAMLIMKKDMGGAATMLALAHMIMGAGLKIALRVLIPAVENSVAGDAFRPLDVYPSRKGMTVEIGNTDAEGRLILADALALADEEKPELLIDAGTLTGAARVALGPELPPYYTDDDALALDVAKHAAAENDPLWRLPLWMRYDQNIDSKVADVNNVAAGGMAGSIICALFMKRFVSAAKSWLHFDIYAWTPSAKPGRPEGGECQAARAVYALLKERYGRA
ncbi:leucyl aminopeptidase family protein [Rhodoplanes sp. Z2-YC6860]|uniref:leucyl aminopeptidase family protein n=1 Tax=Rhodoplanes sp. Z2-YC6860 TaxID=674703 RepID=UPI00078DA63E|nr:leucyl aminopeptidase family protein [Rhodoplanes sp. Z2-YC6860]AMN45118.1 Leucine aminopeptidase [Rhodoplanes sp. Z2-YC6860]